DVEADAAVAVAVERVGGGVAGGAGRVDDPLRAAVRDVFEAELVVCVRVDLVADEAGQRARAVEQDAAHQVAAAGVVATHVVVLDRLAGGVPRALLDEQAHGAVAAEGAPLDRRGHGAGVARQVDAGLRVVAGGDRVDGDRVGPAAGLG